MKSKHQQNSEQRSIRLDGSRIVSPNTRVSPASVFSDPVWYMDGLVTTPGVSSWQKRWDFRATSGFPTGFALSLAEYAYARLYEPVGTHGREGTWLTVQNEITALNTFANFCEQQGLTGFHEIDTPLYEKYLQFLQFNGVEKEKKSAMRVRTLVKVIFRLWEYRSKISEPLTSLPFGKPFEKLFRKSSLGGSSLENVTPVIPEPVYASLMQAALDYVLIYGSTIISAWKELQDVWRNDISPTNPSNNLPGRRLNRATEKILKSHHADWRRDPWTTYGDVYLELHQLRAASMIVVLAYSGIRVSEFLALRAGCYVADECVDGRVRYYINTKVHKHRQKGSRDTWVVIDEVVKAIKILEILSERVRAGAQDDRLILTCKSDQFFSVQNEFIGKQVKELGTNAICSKIQSFKNHCNTKLNRLPIPDVADENGNIMPWSFNTRQFRRTLARYIARQPFGVIAGMIQYKHVEVAVFQGYAGCDPDWNKLLEQEKVLASVDILEEVAMDLSNGQLAGDFGEKIKEDFANEFRGRAEDFPPSQIAKWLSNSSKSLFVGKFNFCFFDPAKALCTQDKVDKHRPIVNFCQPNECENACVAKRHAPKWEAQLQQAEELAIHPKASLVQRELLMREVASLKAVVTNLRK